MPINELLKYKIIKQDMIIFWKTKIQFHKINKIFFSSIKSFLIETTIDKKSILNSLEWSGI